MTDINEHEEGNEPKGKARGGKARAAKLTPEQRKASSKKASEMKKHYASLPSAEYGNNGSALKVGDIEIPCYVLDDGRRVLSQGGVAVRDRHVKKWRCKRRAAHSHFFEKFRGKRH